MTQATKDGGYDVFKILPGGGSVWITTLDDLDVAKQRMASFAAISPATYITYFQGKGVVAEYSVSVEDWVEVT